MSNYWALRRDPFCGRVLVVRISFLSILPSGNPFSSTQSTYVLHGSSHLVGQTFAKFLWC